MEKLVETLGIPSLSQSHVTMTASELDAYVEAFRNRHWMPHTGEQLISGSS